MNEGDIIQDAPVWMHIIGGIVGIIVAFITMRLGWQGFFIPKKKLWGQSPAFKFSVRLLSAIIYPIFGFLFAYLGTIVAVPWVFIFLGWDLD